MAHRAVYKCRLCGEVYKGAQVAGKDIALMCMIELQTGTRGAIPGAPTLMEPHYCGGDHAGALGLADFQGWEKEE